MKCLVRRRGYLRTEDHKCVERWFIYDSGVIAKSIPGICGTCSETSPEPHLPGRVEYFHKRCAIADAPAWHGLP